MRRNESSAHGIVMVKKIFFFNKVFKPGFELVRIINVIQIDWVEANKKKKKKGKLGSGSFLEQVRKIFLNNLGKKRLGKRRGIHLLT